jgi:site-specific DNA recombinase
VQAFLDERQNDNHTRRTYLLSGLLVCGLCGAAITGSRQVRRGQTEYCYYRCASKYLGGWAACDLPSLRVEVIDAAVLACIRTAILTPTRIRELVDTVNAHPGGPGVAGPGPP